MIGFFYSRRARARRDTEQTIFGWVDLMVFTSRGLPIDEAETVRLSEPILNWLDDATDEEEREHRLAWLRSAFIKWCPDRHKGETYADVLHHDPHQLLTDAMRRSKGLFCRECGSTLKGPVA